MQSMAVLSVPPRLNAPNNVKLFLKLLMKNWGAFYDVGNVQQTRRLVVVPRANAPSHYVVSLLAVRPTTRLAIFVVLRSMVIY